MAVKFTIASGSNLNLASIAVNPNASPVATPREGGFTLRNRIVWSSVNSSAALTANGSGDANILRLIAVPSRTIIKALTISAVPGSSAATHGFTSASASAGSGAKLQIGNQGWTDASQSTAKNNLAAFKTSVAIAKTTGLVASTFGTVSTSTPWTQTVPITVASLHGVGFPFGGFVTMNIKNSTGSNGSAMSSAAMAGVMEIRALCDYMPE